VGLVFVPPDKRHRDADNMLAAMKAGLDGLADVLGVDDSRWRLAFEVDRSRIGGFVRVEVAAC
jgi:crossover junction endodeoxyribonuclease RusA